ncbi:hypothetical protein SH1V18_42440 [Vallitalea longa]|uniref:Polysaccharide pyruvyl transferase domain-containing protein n=1 Tax=Vallitalea longa TaxID=2936439 RepID=A0A9W5YH05_9FIRM|nr:polysaccharide pyruvyl transferase family protein [Vallitalea longa]GKX31764.1 hypothetical protein SH1V18_42440 [Vallitalea longa]
MKKKVGIITLHGYENYGNKLQNYALQEVIKNLGYLPHTVVIQEVYKNENKCLRIFKKAIKMSFKELFKNLVEKIDKRKFYYENKALIDKRIKCFKKFSQIHLNEKFYNNSNLELEKISSEYDFFITGSDQVWNPLYIKKAPIYFLTFTEKRKRISYAPSFGRSNIPLEYKEKYKTWLSRMEFLSVREEAGAKIIHELSGKKALVLVDPTLMITKEQWLTISNKCPSKPKSKYILTYFLGISSKETEQYISNISKYYNLRIVNLVDIKDKQNYTTGPSEFIDYINSASVFFTDSFHGVVFSILMETPFVVYNRISKSSSMYSRIETLLDMFRFRCREVHNINSKDQIFNMDFSHVGPILELERKKAVDYLKEALNIEDEVNED